MEIPLDRRSLLKVTPLLRQLASLGLAIGLFALSASPPARASVMLTPYGTRPKDFAFVKQDGVYHLFYIRHSDNLPPWATEIDFGHATSTDLYHWTQQLPILGLQPGSWDNLHVWAPHVVRWGGLWWMFYTGVTETPGVWNDTQRIGAAVSSDLMTWTRALGGPVWSTAGAPWAWWNPHRTGMACRDAFVMPDPAASGQWLMYYTASPASDTAATVIGVARSPQGDPGSWVDLKPLWITYKTYSFSTILESPHLFEHNGRWFLFVTTNAGQPLTFFVSSDPTGDVPAWTPRGRLRNMLGYDTSTWFASESLRDGDLDLFAFVAEDRIDIRRIAWGTGDNFSLVDPAYFHMVSMGWTAPTARENQYIGLRLHSVNGATPHGPLVAWVRAANGTQLPAPTDSLGIPTQPDLSHDDSVVPWFVRRWPASLAATEPMSIRVATDDGTATTPWLTVFANSVAQPAFTGPGGTAPDGAPEDPPHEPSPNPPPPPEDSVYVGPGGAAAQGARPEFGLRVLERTPLGAEPAIVFELPTPGHARVELFDLQGRKRLTLADRTFGAGAQVLPWDGRDATGTRAARGLYFVRVTTTDRIATTRLLLSR